MRKTKKILSEAQIYFLGHIIIDFLWATFLALICTCLLITQFESFVNSLLLSFGTGLIAALSGLFTGFGLRNIKGFKKSEYSYKTITIKK